MIARSQEVEERSVALDAGSASTFGPYVPHLLSAWNPNPIAGGTAVVALADCTVWVAEGWVAAPRDAGALVLRRRGER